MRGEGGGPIQLMDACHGGLKQFSQGRYYEHVFEKNTGEKKGEKKHWKKVKCELRGGSRESEVSRMGGASGMETCHLGTTFPPL